MGSHRHAVLDLEDLHAGVAPDEVGEDALVVRGQVLHQHKGHAGIGVGGHAGKEGLEGRQPPGRGADADDGKGHRWADAQVGDWLCIYQGGRSPLLCLFERRVFLLHAGFSFLGHIVFNLFGIP